MPLIYQKLLSFLFYPLTQSLILLIIALFLFLFKKQRTALSIFLLGTIWLAFFSLPYVANLLLLSLEDDYPVLSIRKIHEADYIVVLGGALTPAPSSGGYFDITESSDRPFHAARLYKAGKAPYLLVSAGALPWDKSSTTEAVAISEFLEIMGVPKSSIIKESNSRNTFENAIRSFEVLKDKGSTHVILITSAWHMKRAKACFESVGFDVVPAAIDYRARKVTSFSVLGWLPNPQALNMSTLAIKEIVGYRVYMYRGWIKS